MPASSALSSSKNRLSVKKLIYMLSMSTEHPNNNMQTSSAWKSGLCSPSMMWCLGCYAPCFVYGQIAGTMTSAELFCGGMECGSCCLYIAPAILAEITCFYLGGTASNFSVWPLSSALGFVVFCPLQTLIHYLLRSAIRYKFNIPGSCLEDCAVICCCSCCAFSQVN